MAAPVVTIYRVTGVDSTPTKGAGITQIDFGNVLAGADSSCACVVYTPVGNSISTAALWNQSDFADANIDPYHKVQLAYQNPAGFAIASGFTTLPVSAITGTSIDEATSNDDTIADGNDTEYVYFIIRVGAGAADGADQCTARLSYNYP
jgi:hypothetical protein